MCKAVDMGVDADKFREVSFQRESFGPCHYFMSARFRVAKVVTHFLLRHYTRRTSMETSQERAQAAEAHSQQ